MIRWILSLMFSWAFLHWSAQAQEEQNYSNYHSQVLEAEQLISSKKYEAAISVYEGLFQDYDFVFLREYQVATQLALYLHQREKGMQFLEKGIKAGWQLKDIKKNKFIAGALDKVDCKSIKKSYPEWKEVHESGLDRGLRKRVKKMFSKDQWKALQALFRFGSKAQDRYAERKFAPHSVKQMKQAHEMLSSNGYPGERLIGNNYWMSTIISHHNSISQEYVRQDTLYPAMRPQLMMAIEKGYLSPYVFLIIDDWYHTVSNASVYGIINPPSKSKLVKVNSYRKKVFVRSIELRNKLVDVSDETGMNLYLEVGPWVDGKIQVTD